MLPMPKFVLPTMQACVDAGLNAFALQLVAESYSDGPTKFADAPVLVRMEDHKHREVWIMLWKEQPRPEDFSPAPPAAQLEPPPASLPG